MTVVPISTVRSRARRQRGLNVLTDLEVWPYDATKIIGMCLDIVAFLVSVIQISFQLRHLEPGDLLRIVTTSFTFIES
jgi:hypothetical protein